MATSFNRADDGENAPNRPHPGRLVNALIGALVTFFLALMALAYNAGIASANIQTLKTNQDDLSKEVAILRDSQSSSRAEIIARLSTMQQMQQDMSNTQAQIQAQLQAKNFQGSH